MAEKVHPAPQTNTPAREGKEEKCGLRNAPETAPGAAFIHTAEKQREEIDAYQVYEKEVHKQAFLW